MNFIRNRKFRAGPQTSLEGFICPQNSDKQQKIKVFGRSGGVVLVNVSFTQPNKRLAGKTIFISGGTSGIGKNMAKTFMEEGATVIVSGRKEENLKELNAAYPEIHTIKWDIADILDRILVR